MERAHLFDPAAVALTGLLASAALVSAACSGNPHPVSTPPAPGGPVSRGTASWYGPEFDGRHTANGERYDMHSLTAAHPSLPFGTLVQVTNLENGRQVVVRINDRGPFAHRRIIDLSYAAARELEMIGPGTARVELAVVGRSEPMQTPAAAQPILTAAAAAPAAAAGAAPGDAHRAVTAARSEAPPAAVAAAPATIGAPAEMAARTGPAARNYTVQVGAFGEAKRAAALQQDLARRYPQGPQAAVRSDGIWHRVQVGLFGDRDQAEALRRELAAIGLAAIVVATP